jgi:hypothetical protein
MKRIAIGIMALCLLCCLTTAFAGTAGTSQDPLISKSYIDGTYKSSVIKSGEEAIDKGLTAAYDSSAAKITASSGTASSGYVYLAVKSTGTMTLTTGASVIVTGGSVTIGISNGAVIDVSSGTEVTSGTKLKSGVRYFCAEDTTAVLTASSASGCLVDGGYSAATGVSEAFTQYSDVSPSDWFYDAAVYAYNSKLFTDYASGAFKPSADATRAETVYALWMAVGSPKATTTATFSDLTENWYLTAVSWAVENGITNGGENNKFKPNDSLTREQLAVIMYRYTAYAGGSTSERSDLSSFTDSGKIASWASNEMSWANAVGIITGTSKTEMSPQMTASRSQVATVLMRYVK